MQTKASPPIQLLEGRSTLPWTSFRSCTSTRDGVVLTLTTGQPIGLPRALFPPTELARLQQSVSRPRTP